MTLWNPKKEKENKNRSKDEDKDHRLAFLKDRPDRIHVLQMKVEDLESSFQILDLRITSLGTRLDRIEREFGIK